MNDYDDTFRDVYRLQPRGRTVEVKPTKTDWDEDDSDDIVERLTAMATTIEGLAHYTDDHATLLEAIILIRTHALPIDHPLAID